jgi:predicted AlkP superfamily pyrophosphatase or phosphodiesterase
MKSAHLLLGAAALALACQSLKPALKPASPPAPQRGAPASVVAAATPPAVLASAPHRVVMISLDGASSDELHRLYAHGDLQAGGFARFFRDGAVAERMIPVNPTLTAVNHISLATGADAGHTGIVSNLFHPAGAPLTEKVSGFVAPIGAETLWEAVERQGKRVGVTTWPGADANEKPEAPRKRRTADWGMIYVNTPDRRADLVSLSLPQWQPYRGDSPFEVWSPVLAATLRSEAVGTLPEGGDRYQVLALDHTDDEKVDYDAVAVSTPAAGEPIVLTRGAWGRVPCTVPAKNAAGGRPAQPARAATCSLKLVALEPQLGRVLFYFGAVYPLRAYPEDFAAALAREGLAWPGPPDGDRLEEAWAGRPGIDLDTWTEQSERFARFFGDSLLVALARPDWDLLMAYLPVIDEAGHELLLADPRQEGYTGERERALAAARLRVWKAVDRELDRWLERIDLHDTTVVVVSDHGMTPVHTALDANVLLAEKGYLAADAEGKVLPERTRAYAIGDGGICHVYVAPGSESLLPALRQLFAGWRAAPRGDARGEASEVLETIAGRSELAALGLDSPNSGELVLFAREGFSFHGSGLKEGRAARPSGVYGMHGYLNSHPDMHAIYLALGAGVKAGDASTLHSTDVAGRVAAWLGIRPPGTP